jgi:hypothetical protein
LSDARENEAHPDPCPGRSPPWRRNHRTHAQGTAATQTTDQRWRYGRPETGGHCEVSWPPMAYRLDGSSHRTGFWTTWLPFTLPQCWPFAWWLAWPRIIFPAG